jgi:type I restriction enzyme R subunit
MVFYSGKLVLALDNPTVVVLTDRNDLDDQLYDTFFACQQLLRQEPRQAENRKHLRELLSVASGGIVFTTIQKFMPGVEEIDPTEPASGPKVEYIGAGIKALSARKNIIVIADEAHRSQYDFIDGFAKHLRDALPNASFIGFTGTLLKQLIKIHRQFSEITLIFMTFSRQLKMKPQFVFITKVVWQK